jgi:hypothetical protein
MRRLRSAERILTDGCFVIPLFPLIHASPSKGDLKFLDDLVIFTQPQLMRPCGYDKRYTIPFAWIFPFSVASANKQKR